MYHNGEGVPRDYVQAHMWFSIAGENGIEEVTRNLDIVTKKMTSTQVADAQRLAREWLQKQNHPLRVGQ
jgi:TPR repeat protein